MTKQTWRWSRYEDGVDGTGSMGGACIGNVEGAPGQALNSYSAGGERTDVRVLDSLHFLNMQV